VEDIRFELDLSFEFIKDKLAFLENQMVARTMTNLTPQQLEGYSETFKHFDKDQSNTLNKSEFKAALQAEGIHLFENDMEKIMKEHGTGAGDLKELNFQQFIDVMRSIEEDRFSPSQLEEAFNALSLNKGFLAEKELLTSTLAPPVLEFFKSNVPKTQDGQGFDYKKCKFFIVG
jgi:Ca2+-binding EF-hand superfamily protein